MQILVLVGGTQQVALIPHLAQLGAPDFCASLASAVSALQKGGQPPHPWGDDSLKTFLALAQILTLNKAFEARGCLVLAGELGSKPVEVHVKGPTVPRSKRASHALVTSMLLAEECKPEALLFADGDSGAKEGSIARMLRMLRSEQLGGVTPVLLPERIGTSALLWQAVRNWGISGVVWASQSCLGFQHPACGAFAMFSTESMVACAEEYCKVGEEESLWDSMMLEMGEDAFLTHALLERGFSVCHLLDCEATAFMPESWQEYLSQQSRWKRSHLGNRADLLARRWGAWAGARKMFYAMDLLDCVNRGEFLGAGFTVWLCSKITGPPLHELTGKSRWECELLVLGALWLLLAPYALLSAGSAVAERPGMHGFAMLIAVLLPACQLALLFVYWQAHHHWFFWTFMLAPAGLATLARLPHGGVPFWAPLAMPLAPLLVRCIEQVLAPIHAVANADATAMMGWGTRQDDRERAALAKLEQLELQATRRSSRRRLLAAWLSANVSFGCLLHFAPGHVGAGARLFVLACVPVNLSLDLCLGLGYSAWLCRAGCREGKGELAPEAA